MTLSALFRDYAAYNHWANSRLVDWLRNQPAELLDEEIASSFPSLRLTLLHIWDAQYIWYERLQGTSPAVFPSKQYDGLAQDVFDGLLRSSEKLAQLLLGFPDEFFEGTVVYKTTAGKEHTNLATEMLLQVLQHSTYHRGQIVTMARGLGLTDPPGTDYIAYVRLKSASVN